ncbi:hypothetical protein [Nocardia sp. NPDC058480]|uniref:hypothetical protein n=1 Tax=Nocardia sp. NPDC058480 TaxID=3346522 RepID=UPI00364CF34B
MRTTPGEIEGARDDGFGQLLVRRVMLAANYYNFEAKNWIPFGNVKRNTANEIGAHMRDLEEIGWARSYVARGQSDTIQTWVQKL